MPQAGVVDYDALAKKYGAATAGSNDQSNQQQNNQQQQTQQTQSSQQQSPSQSATPNYDALAQKYGASSGDSSGVSTDGASSDDPTKMGFAKSTATSLGVPTKAKDVLPWYVESTLAPLVPGASQVLKAYKTAKQGGGIPEVIQSALGIDTVKDYAGKVWDKAQNVVKESKEAIQNVKSGQPIIPNVGKGLAAESDLTESIAAPVGGESIQTAGEQFASGNTGGGAGTLTGTAIPYVIGEAANVASGYKGAKAGVQPKFQETIAGESLPKTYAQSVGEPRGPAASTEKFLKGSIVGKPLRDVEAAQQSGAQNILSTLSESSAGETIPKDPAAIEQNWRNAAEATRKQAGVLYQRVGAAAQGADFSSASKVAQDLLNDEEMRRVYTNPQIGKSAQSALEKLGGVSLETSDEANQISQQIFQKSVDKLQPDQLQTLKGVLSTQGITIPDATNVPYEAARTVRSTLQELIENTPDLNEKRILGKALGKVDDAITNSLTDYDKKNNTNSYGDWREANRLWTKNYAQKSFADALNQMLQNQSRLSKRGLPTQSLVKTINDLEDSGQLKYLFDNKTDVNSLKKLGDFLQRTQPGGGGNITGTMGKIAMILGALKIPVELVTGSTGAAGAYAGLVGTGNIVARVLARPAGAATILNLLKTSSGATARYAFLAGQLNRMAREESSSGNNSQPPKMTPAQIQFLTSQMQNRTQTQTQQNSQIKYTQPTNQPSAYVDVLLPDGSYGEIPAANAESARAKGWKVLDGR